MKANRHIARRRLGIAITAVAGLLLAAAPGAAQKAVPRPSLPLMPYPQQVVEGEGRLPISSDFSLHFSRYRSPRLERAKRRTLARLARQTGLRLSADSAPGEWATLIVAIDGPAPSTVPSLDDDERYSLEVSSGGARLHAPSPRGALYGLETFLQLVTLGDDGNRYLPSVRIVDYPSYPWRGLLIDSARRFFSVATIKRQLDGMASAKYNVLHWHLTDDQAWRIESRALPKLHRQGSAGRYYRQEDIRSVVEYASELGIRVVPEFDFPGHVSAIALAYPELMSAPGPYRPETRWGVHEPTMNPLNEDVYRFIDTLIAEMKTLFPDPYIHIGGDEVNPKQWNENEDIQVFMQKQGLRDHHQLHAWFNRKLAAILKKHGRKMLGWDEILHADLPAGTVIQSWRGADALARAAALGHEGILSAGYYLDQPQPASYHYRNHPVASFLRVDDRVHTGERVERWQFVMPRRKGSAVQGAFTLIGDGDGIQRGFIDIRGRTRRALRDIDDKAGTLRFWLDTWMGKTTFILQRAADELAGAAIVANGRYPVTGKRLPAPAPGAPTPGSSPWPLSLTAAQRARVLGGEAALWSELVSEQVIDLRLWPRAYVVGERLWSDKNLVDEENMYRRLSAVSRWAVTSVQLRHRRQAVQGLQRLAGSADIRPLQILSEAVEQAQYYHRHHEKYLAGHYHKDAPLDGFADALPAESSVVRTLGGEVRKLLRQPDNPLPLAGIVDTLLRWRDNHPALTRLLAARPPLVGMQGVAVQVRDVAELGLACIGLLRRGEQLGAEQAEAAQRMLTKAKEINQELVVAAAYPVGRLLELCR